MTEGFSIDFGKFVIGFSESFANYGKSETKDGRLYQLWRFFIWIKGDKL